MFLPPSSFFISLKSSSVYLSSSSSFIIKNIFFYYYYYIYYFFYYHAAASLLTTWVALSGTSAPTTIHIATSYLIATSWKNRQRDREQTRNASSSVSHCVSFGSRSCVRACDYRGGARVATVENGGWVFHGTGGCSVNGEQGKYGPNLVRPRLSFRDCARYANNAKVKVLTMYGDGFCMVQYLTRKDCLYSNLRIFGTGWVTAWQKEPSPAANYTNDNMRGFQCFMKSA